MYPKCPHYGDDNIVTIYVTDNVWAIHLKKFSYARWVILNDSYCMSHTWSVDKEELNLVRWSTWLLLRYQFNIASVPELSISLKERFNDMDISSWIVSKQPFISLTIVPNSRCVHTFSLNPSSSHLKYNMKRQIKFSGMGIMILWSNL